MKARGYLALLRGNRNFRLLWFAQIVSEIGDWLYAVVIYDTLLERTEAAVSVAVAVILQVLPQVAVAPFAGVINDRLRRRSVMIVSDVVRSAIVLAMLAAVQAGMIGPIYLLLLLETAMWAFFEPARGALLPNLTRNEDETLAANTLSSTTWSFNLAVGSALGGLIAAGFGRAAVFLINAASFLISAWFLTRMKVQEPHVISSAASGTRGWFDASSVWETYHYVRGDRQLLASLWAKAGIGLMGSSYVILTLYGKQVFPVAKQAILGMSVLMAARGLGALIGPLVGGWWVRGKPERFRSGILFGFLLGAAGYVGLGLAPGLAHAVLCVVVAHSGGSMIWVFQTTILQTRAADHFRGRVFSADLCFLVIAMSISLSASGAAVDAGLPVRQASLLVGLALLFAAALWGYHTHADKTLGGFRRD